MMFKLTPQETHVRFGGDLRIAAQGAIDNQDGSIRVVHDGTHGVQVNQRIIMRDLQPTPRADDLKKGVLGWLGALPGATVALNADVKKAHCRVLVRPCDWGKLGCKSGIGDRIWFHRVGTFVVSSASY
eukprot:3623852-Amphidinium_carterae.1